MTVLSALGTDVDVRLERNSILDVFELEVYVCKAEGGGGVRFM